MANADLRAFADPTLEEFWPQGTRLLQHGMNKNTDVHHHQAWTQKSLQLSPFVDDFFFVTQETNLELVVFPLLVSDTFI